MFDKAQSKRFVTADTPFRRSVVLSGALFGLAFVPACEKQSSSSNNSNAENKSGTAMVDSRNEPLEKPTPSEVKDNGIFPSLESDFEAASLPKELPSDPSRPMEAPLITPKNWNAVSVLNQESWDSFSKALLNSQVFLISKVLETQDPRVQELMSASYSAMSQNDPDARFAYAVYCTARGTEPDRIKMRTNSLRAYVSSALCLMHEGYHKAHHKTPAKTQREFRQKELEAHTQEVKDCYRFIAFLEQSPEISSEWRQHFLKDTINDIQLWKDMAQFKANLYEVGIMTIDLGLEQKKLYGYSSDAGLTNVMQQLDALRPKWSSAFAAKLESGRIADNQAILQELESIFEGSKELKAQSFYEPFRKKAVAWHAALQRASDHYHVMEQKFQKK